MIGADDLKPFRSSPGICGNGEERIWERTSSEFTGRIKRRRHARLDMVLRCLGVF